MANSLRAKLKKLRYEGHISDSQYRELIAKLEGHDTELRRQILEEFKEDIKGMQECLHEQDKEFAKERERYLRRIADLEEKLVLYEQKWSVVELIFRK